MLVAPILCEIIAPRAKQAAALAKIAATCAQDVAQPLTVQQRVLRLSREQANVTLHLPAQDAYQENQVWCLACRLACFCPDALVSVLIHGETAFAPSAGEASSRREQRRSA